MFQLYPYQTDAVEALRENIRNGIRKQVLCAPTGSGKTVIATHMIQQAVAKGKRCIFVVDRIALIDQTSRTLAAHGISHGVIQGNHHLYRPLAPVQVASSQTLTRREWPEGLNLVIVDEAHTMYNTVTEFVRDTDAVVIGLTATPFAKGLGDLYDAVVSVTTTYDLISDGKLSSFEIFAPSEPDMTGAATNGFGEWTGKAVEERFGEIIGDVVEQYTRHGWGKKFICFGANISHCRSLAQQFNSAGIRTELYTSRVPNEERELILEEYRKPDSQIRGLVSVAALAKGFDVPDVSCIIIARPLKKSLAEHIQIVGRGLRRDPDQPGKVCTILDHAGNWMRFADEVEDFFRNSLDKLDETELKERVETSRETEESWRKCPSCKHVHNPKPNCPKCGYEYPTKQVVHTAGELERLDQASPAMLEMRRSWFNQIHTVQQARGYKPGYVGKVYKQKFGSYPPRSWIGEIVEVGTEVANYCQRVNTNYAKQMARKAMIKKAMASKRRSV